MLRAGRTIGAAIFVCLCGVGCSPSRIGISRMASALSDTAGAYSTDNDPEFVRLAAPSTLKMVEMLLEQQPTHEGLLMTACSGFTQYAYAFLEIEAERVAPQDAAGAVDLRTRARTMYRRAKDYCWRALELQHPGLRAAVTNNPEAAVKQLAAADVPGMYWVGVSWAGELGLADNQLLRLQELVAIRVLLGRAIALDEGWEEGSIHEAFISLDGMSLLLGGSAARAREHFDRAVALSKGHSAFAYVTFASTVSVSARDRKEFDTLLKTALAIDPDVRPSRRLTTLVAQRRARTLLARADAIFKR
jgi:predicted anti-sigma-YlaC factor YlaD